MKSIDFPRANLAIAKDQPQYQTLYAFKDPTNDDPQGLVTFCLELDEQEKEQIAKTGKVFFTQLTFNRGFQPINMSVLNPFPPVQGEEGAVPMDENRTPVEEWDQSHWHDSGRQGMCVNCGNFEVDHYWSTRQCKL
jgi:hypothetical protein